MAHHDHHEELRAPKAFEVPSKFKTVCMVLFIAGFLTFAIALFAGAKDAAWDGYLIGYWFTLSLSLSGPFIIATQHLSIAGWSTSIRRIPEAYGWFLLPALVLSFGALWGGDTLFPWFHEEAFHNPIMAKKQGFLNELGMAATTIISVLVWIGVWWMLRSQSIKQDEDGDYGRTNTMKALSALWLIVFVVGFSTMSWYWLMSLQPLWFSTMWNVYAFAGLFQSGLALTAILVLYFKENDYFGDFVGTRQIHDLGQLLFGFTVFYAYIAFSQFLLIWYANIPEEAIWYVTRGTPPDVTTGWEFFTLALPFLKFVIPFFVLLPQVNKKNKYNILKYVAYGLIAMQIYEVWWWVSPAPIDIHAIADAPHVPLVELATVLGFLGLFGLVVSWGLTQANLVPVKDPFLHEAVEHHHHGTMPPKPDNITIT